jgi:hypothetical protein
MGEIKAREGRAKLEVNLKIADREALDRYCACMNVNLTQFVTNRIRERERKMLSRLNEEQRAAYLAGGLILEEMSEEDRAAFHTLTAIRHRRDQGGLRPAPTPSRPQPEQKRDPELGAAE